jgi:thiamine-phosphate pyrophosphorylase
MSVEPKRIDFKLYLITDRSQAKGGDLLNTLEEALASGVRAVSLREKDLKGRELFELARKVRKLTVKYDAKLFINDRIDVALASGAAGVHLGEVSIPVGAARKVCKDMLIGCSTHSLEGAKRAVAAGADFITFGPIFETPSKVKFGPPQGVKKLLDVVSAVDIPVFAIGGIKADNLDSVMAEGRPFGVAIISGIIAAPSPGKAAKVYLEKANVRI